MSEEERLLRELIDTIRTAHLDMSGKHKYVLGHKSHAIINEIKGYLYEKDRADIDLS